MHNISLRPSAELRIVIIIFILFIIHKCTCCVICFINHLMIQAVTVVFNLLEILENYLTFCLQKQLLYYNNNMNINVRLIMGNVFIWKIMCSKQFL